MTPLIYRSPRLYQSLMRTLHGRHFEDRYRIIASHVPAGSRVVELCAGDARLYTHHLQQKQVDYLGLDLSPAFVSAAHRKGIPFERHNLFLDPVPTGEVIIMQAALYIFYPQAEHLIQKMLESASLKVVITEPILNLSTSKNRPLAWIARVLTGTTATDPSTPTRFDGTSLRQLLSRFDGLQSVQLDASGREMTGVITPMSPSTAAS